MSFRELRPQTAGQHYHCDALQQMVGSETTYIPGDDDTQCYTVGDLAIADWRKPSLFTRTYPTYHIG